MLPRLSALMVATFIASSASANETKPLIENCGWLVVSGESLTSQTDENLKPSDAKPLPTPPQQAEAAYCIRDTLMTYTGDERLIKLGLPFIIRSGGKEGVLEYPPQVVFNYHRDGDHYAPGRAPKQP